VAMYGNALATVYAFLDGAHDRRSNRIALPRAAAALATSV
jgi:hypothetical protein